MMERTILHVDMNSFFASVESLTHPEVLGHPMAVCGDAEKRRGIILAKNELAKQMGVKTGEAIWEAQRKCPGLLLLPPHHALYRELSQKANAIYGRFTDTVEPASIDESYLDVTGSLHLHGTGADIADAIHAAVRKELHLTVSIGVSFCKSFAKMGSDYHKPDATTIITRENYTSLLYPLPVTDLLFVGKATASRLAQLGVHTIGDLAKLEEPLLRGNLGKHGSLLYCYVHGLDDSPVLRTEEQCPIKSVGNGMTFPHDLTTVEEVRAGTLQLCESVAARLRRHQLKCRSIQITIKTPEFKVIDRQHQLEYPANTTLTLFETAYEIIQHNWHISPQHPIRLITVTAIELIPAGSEQLSLFSDPRKDMLDKIRDELNQKFGPDTVRPASLLRGSPF